MPGAKPIPIPLSQRWRRFRYLLLPYLVVGVSIVTISWLWRKQGEFANAVGEVEAVRIDVAVANDGLLVPLPQVPWTLFDAVQENKIIARLDDAQVQAGLKTLAAEMIELEKQVGAAEAQVALDQFGSQYDKFREAIRLAFRVENLRLQVLDRNVELAAREVEFQRLAARADFLEPLRDGGFVTELELIDARLLRDETAARIKEAEIARDEVFKQGRVAIERFGQVPEIERAEIEKILAPLRAALATQESRIDQLRLQLDSLVVRAPIDGIITSIHAWPGQAVRAGDPIVTLAADQGRYIVSYVAEDQAIEPRIGMTVAVRPRANPREQHEATVERIGPQVEPVPLHQLLDPTKPQWGLPVRIALPAKLAARPGELIDITFRREAFADNP
ncbi:MAG: HlyD family efflux transporter periplasmic adaptor subunit [Planctomycetales bacterium]|nr:HlyD family efflux transporter periplasmic adaptor subunit [Planctomycetales bacterium]